MVPILLYAIPLYLSHQIYMTNSPGGVTETVLAD